MSFPARVFYDVTFTRTQVGSVAITRTVRRLGEEIRAALPVGASFTRVAFHRSGFRVAAAASPAAQVDPASTRAARAMRAVTRSWVRRAVVRWIPVPLLLLAESVYNGTLVDRLSRDEQPVAFRPGDLLLLCDAGWARPVWRAAAAARAQGAHVLVLVHDLIPVLQPEFATPVITRIFERWLHGIVPNCDAIMCNSRATQDSLLAYAQRRAMALPPVGHFRLGADLAAATAGRACREHVMRFVCSPVPCFGVVGTIEPRKNHAWLLHAFEELWAAGHEVRLVVMGRTNPECHAVVRRMLEHPEQGRRLLTVLDAPDGEVALLYAHGRALVFPSLAEGFGLPLVEARTRGCPVIASDLPVFAELADAGVFLYDRSSLRALQQLVLQHAAHDHRVEVGAMEAFTWQDSASEFLLCAGQLLALGSGVRRSGAGQMPISDAKSLL